MHPPIILRCDTGHYGMFQEGVTPSASCSVRKARVHVVGNVSTPNARARQGFLEQVSVASTVME